MSNKDQSSRGLLKQQLQKLCGTQVQNILQCKKECNSKKADSKVICKDQVYDLAHCAARIYCIKEANTVVEKCSKDKTNEECKASQRNLSKCFESKGLPTLPLE